MTKEELRNLRLQRTYGITSAEYDEILAKQFGGCAICGRPPKKLALAVDHDHGYKRIKIKTKRLAMPKVIGYPDAYKWQATAVYRNREYKADEYGIHSARRTVRNLLKKASIRGLLCWLCNVGLRRFNHEPISLARAADYLRRWKEGPLGDAVPQAA